MSENVLAKELWTNGKNRYHLFINKNDHYNGTLQCHEMKNIIISENGNRLTSGYQIKFDNMSSESELIEMAKQWIEKNDSKVIKIE